MVINPKTEYGDKYRLYPHIIICNMHAQWKKYIKKDIKKMIRNDDGDFIQEMD